MTLMCYGQTCSGKTYTILGKFMFIKENKNHQD